MKLLSTLGLGSKSAPLIASIHIFAARKLYSPVSGVTHMFLICATAFIVGLLASALGRTR